jgi:hypothetical protein
LLDQSGPINMGFGGLATSSYQQITGFSPDALYQWATSTIDTFSAGVLGTLIVFSPQVVAGIMILTIVFLGLSFYWYFSV